MVTFDSTDSSLGTYPVLALHGGVAASLGLSAAAAGEMVLADTNGAPAVALRSWWTMGIHDDSDRETHDVIGCALLVRPDVFQRIEGAVDGRVVSITRIIRKPLRSTE